MYRLPGTWKEETSGESTEVPKTEKEKSAKQCHARYLQETETACRVGAGFPLFISCIEVASVLLQAVSGPGGRMQGELCCSETPTASALRGALTDALLGTGSTEKNEQPRPGGATRLHRRPDMKLNERCAVKLIEASRRQGGVAR